MKEQIKKEYLRRTRKQLKTKLYSRNLIKKISTWVVSLVRYSGTILEVDERRIITNGPENKKTNDNA